MTGLLFTEWINSTENSFISSFGKSKLAIIWFSSHHNSFYFLFKKYNKIIVEITKDIINKNYIYRFI